jgi:putative endopeptidase
VLAGSDKVAAAAAAQVVMRMETSLADASLTNVELRDPYARDHPMKLDDVQKLTPDFNWGEYFKALHVDPRVVLNVDQPKFMQEFQRQLRQTSLADWKTYLTWQVLLTAAPALSTPFVQEDFAFNEQYLQGAKEIKPRWKRCVESTDANLGEALGKKYVEKTFSPEAKARMQEMVKNILLALHDDILTLTWMSDETKQKALEKLSTFNLCCAKTTHPREIESNTRVTNPRLRDISRSRWSPADNKDGLGTSRKRRSLLPSHEFPCTGRERPIKGENGYRDLTELRAAVVTKSLCG